MNNSPEGAQGSANGKTPPDWTLAAAKAIERLDLPSMSRFGTIEGCRLARETMIAEVIAIFAERQLAQSEERVKALEAYARFGKEILDQAKLACAEGLIGEEHEHQLELAAKLGAGGVRREPYDPNVHQAIDCEPGDLIWSWSPLLSSSKTN